MDLFSFQEFIQQRNVAISLSNLLQSFEQNTYQCIFVKNQQSQFMYANQNFIQLMGLKNLQQLRYASDLELSTHARDAKKYKELDSCVLEEKKPLGVKETIVPKKNKSVIKTMKGTLYPLISNHGQADYILGVVAPESKLLKLDWDTLFRLTPDEMRELLVKRSFKFEFPRGCVSLSKMELLCLIQLLKGQHAGEIAQSLNLKQTTVESYLGSVKNKLGVNHKSELLNLVMKHTVLQQIIL